MGASNGAFGTIRALPHVSHILANLGVLMLPVVAVPTVAKAFDEPRHDDDQRPREEAADRSRRAPRAHHRQSLGPSRTDTSRMCCHQDAPPPSTIASPTSTPSGPRRPRPTRANLAFYVDAYLAAEGPVVELGVGDGRIAVQAAARGRGHHRRGPLVGHARALPPTRRGAPGVLERLTLIQADFRHFELPAARQARSRCRTTASATCCRWTTSARPSPTCSRSSGPAACSSSTTS